jgi:hypothetical protein
MGERERERKTAAVVDEGLKASADWSTEERYYNRSRKIRRKIRRWLEEHVGYSWSTEESMAAQAANYADCSSVTARRWIHQLTQPGTLFQVNESTELYTLAWRRELEQ